MNFQTLYEFLNRLIPMSAHFEFHFLKRLDSCLLHTIQRYVWILHCKGIIFVMPSLTSLPCNHVFKEKGHIARITSLDLVAPFVSRIQFDSKCVLLAKRASHTGEKKKNVQERSKGKKQKTDSKRKFLMNGGKLCFWMKDEQERK